MVVTGSWISKEFVEGIAYELNKRAAVNLPEDGLRAFEKARDSESKFMAQSVLSQVVENAKIAVADSRPMCGDTGLPRFYVKAGNDSIIEGGFVSLEGAVRRGTARCTRDMKLRANRVHPLTRKNPGNNVGIFAPSVDYSFEPGVDWVEMTCVHKGGLFGMGYKMLFPSDGINGIKRFFLDVMSEFGRRGLSCPPVVVGVGIGGAKDQCVRLSKEACSLRVIGDRHPDPDVANLEDELFQLGNKMGFGAMGLEGDIANLDVHVEIAHTHTGGLPVSINQFCLALRRATARMYPNGKVEYRHDPQWFTDYYRRSDIE